MLVFFFFTILIPALLSLLTLVFLIAWLWTKDFIYGKIIGYLWLGLFGLFFLGRIISFLTDKKELDKSDYYGEYIVNREYFKGRQADWQYDNFRFEIKDNDSIYFYLTDKEKILKTYRGTITTKEYFRSERLVINMDQPTHHIMTSNPTTYRSAWSFYLVFYSPKFNNVYFRKGKWKPLHN
jgi:hypothetical protein